MPVSAEKIVEESSSPLLEKHESWERAKLGNIADILNGFAFKSTFFNEKKGIPLLRIRDIGKQRTDTLYDGSYDSKYIIEKGDLIIGMDGLFKSAIWKGPSALLNQRVCKIKIHSEHYSLYFLALVLPAYLTAIQYRTPSVTVKHISSNTIAQIPLPLPPLAEQHRIVTKVKSLLQENRTAKQALEKIPPLIENFRQSVLTKAFRGELIQPDFSDEPADRLLERIRLVRRKRWEDDLKEKGKDPRKFIYEEPKSVEVENLFKLPANWIWTNIDTIKLFLGSGITPRGGKKNYVKEGIPFIRSQNVYPDGLHLENVVYVTPEMHAKMKRTYVEPKDVLLNITGASIGRCTFVPDNFGSANVNQHVCIIRTSELILPSYLSSFLNSHFGQSQIFSAQSGVTREGLNYSQLRSLNIPLAPFNEQRGIIAKIEGLFLFADQIDESVEKARNQVEVAEQAILAKAFRGELVSQDPKDEPATILLQTIRKKTAKMKTKVSKKKHKIGSPKVVQRKFELPSRNIFNILQKVGEAPVESVFRASRLSMSEFWDELGAEMDAGRIEKTQKGKLVLLKVKS